MKKKGPYILLLILAIFLVFVLGVRYGQRVERTNKIINYLISLPPSPSAAPTQSPLEFKTFASKLCGIKFLYPSNLNVKDSSSSGAFLTNNTSEEIDFTCIYDPKGIPSILDDSSIASASLTLKNQKILAKAISSDRYSFKFTNNLNLKTIYVTISKSLYPLFEKSLEFTP